MSGGIIGNLMFAVGFKVGDSALKKAQKQVGALKENMYAFGIAAAAGVAAMAGFGVAAVHAASEFEKSMSHVQQATGQTAEQMEETKGIAKELYAQNFGQNWDDLGQSIATVAQVTKQTGDDLKQTTRDALLLRDAFGFEVAEATRAANNAMDNFGISSREAFNLFAQGKQKGLDASGDLLDTVNEYSVFFDKLGFSANEMFDSLAAGAGAGARDLDKVADAVKEFTIRSKDGSKTSMQAFEMLGLNAEQMMQTFAAGGPKAKQAFTQIIQMISDVEDPVAQNTIGVALMGTQFEDLETGVIAAMGTAKSQFDMTKNKMDELNQIKLETPGQALSMFGRQVETGVLIPIGERLMPYLNQFGQWLSDNQPLLNSIGDTIGSVLGGSIEFVSNSISFLSENLDIIVPALAGFAAVILYSMLPAFTAWIAAQWASAVAGWAAIAPWLPIIGLALLIAAAITGIILIFKNWGKISEWLSEKWNKFKSWCMNLFNSIVEYFKTWGSVIKNFFSSVWNSIWKTVSSVGQSIWTTISGIWTGIKDGATAAWNGIADGVLGLWDNIKRGFATGVNFIIRILNGMIDMINEAISFDIPDWLGGGHFDLGIPKIPEMKVDGSHADGLDYVPYDGYVAELHEGERVMTAAENKASRSPAAPARVAGGANGIHIELTIPVTVTGGGDGERIGQDIASQIKPVLLQVIESAMRRGGIEGAG